MKISSISVTNIMGIDELTVRPGSMTLIEGRNGAGKTSMLTAIRALCSGGHDPSILRKGAESGRVEVLLDDGVELSMTVTPTKTVRTVRDPERGRISKPQEYIDKLVGRLGVDPVAFIQADEKQRLDMLLAAVPLTISAEQVSFLPVRLLEGVDLEEHALSVLDTLRRSVYDERTQVNREARQKRSTCEQLRKALPDRIDDEPEKAAAEAREAYDRYIADTERRRSEVKDTYNEERRKVLAWLDEQVSIARKQAEAMAAEAVERRDSASAAIEAEFKVKVRELERVRAEAEERARAVQKARGAMETLDAMQMQAKELEERSEKLTAALERLDSLKKEIIGRIPIRGVEIVDGKLHVDGVPYDRANEARQIQVALEVARLRAGEVPLILVDDAEHFDSANMSKLHAAAAKAGLQIIAARVSDGGLAVKTEGS